MPVGDNYYVRRRAEMSRMRERGISILEIGRLVGISKQRVAQILGNTGYLSGKVRHTALVKKVRALTPRYLRGEISAYELADAVGYNYGSVMLAIKEIGLSKRAIRGKLLSSGKCYCSRCQKTKAIKEFTRKSGTSTGYGICKKCNAEKSRLHRQKERNASGR